MFQYFNLLFLSFTGFTLCNMNILFLDPAVCLLILAVVHIDYYVINI